MARSTRSTAQRRRDASDPSPAAEYYVLDMGREQYGDSILCRFGDKTVLIDGGHPSDFAGQPNYDSIPDQLSAILGVSPPFNISLLVITHAHNDHIGCLPKMVAAGTINAKFALVADPDLGFPPGYRDFVEGLDAIDPNAASAIQRAVAAISEEDHSFLPDEELDAFLDAASTLGVRYRDMLDALEAAGTRVFKWGTSDPVGLQPIYQELQGTGFDIIGPSVPHLEICRDQIVAFARNVRDELINLVQSTPRDTQKPAIVATDLYRSARRGAGSDIFADRKGQGSALNCQSVVLSFGTGNQKVLLAADMQFADPEVNGIDGQMEDLINKVVANGPYKFVKTTHHTSYNGINKELWRKLGKPPLLVHSGGLNDDKHPERGALDELRNLSREITFARTDRNGQIFIDPRKNDEDALTISRGRLNDFTPNPSRRRDLPVAAASSQPQPPQPIAVPPPPVKSAAPSFIDITFVRIPYQDGRISIDGRVIEISGRGPGGIRNDGGSAGAQEIDPQPALAGTLGGGRDMSKLLFVTDSRKLESNIGQTEAQRVMRMIATGAKCIMINGMNQPETAVRKELGTGKYRGVVIVGGYDVVPSQRVDVLDANLRASIPREAIIEDRDEFIVWSDDIWGDIGGEGMPDFPVSRVPDARSPSLVTKALQASAQLTASGRFGIRNTLRPFAASIFNQLPGPGQLLESAPTSYNQIPSGAAAQPYLYFMLHGLDRDGSRFWGDNPGRGAVEAINVSCLPADGLGVALAGCCWGALTVDQRANDRTGIISPKATGSSIALSVLAAGARAFVGCTGVHYSPGPQGTFFGGPMQKGFWDELIVAGRPPAEALFEARKKYLASMPHGRHIPLELGIERKIYKQFTCLGLGW